MERVHTYQIRPRGRRQPRAVPVYRGTFGLNHIIISKGAGVSCVSSEYRKLDSNGIPMPFMSSSLACLNLLSLSQGRP